VLARKSQVVSDGELAVKLRLQVGELWEVRLGDNERAVQAYKEVLTVESRRTSRRSGAGAVVREGRPDGRVPRGPGASARGHRTRGWTG